MIVWEHFTYFVLCRYNCPKYHQTARLEGFEERSFLGSVLGKQIIIQSCQDSRVRGRCWSVYQFVRELNQKHVPRYALGSHMCGPVGGFFQVCCEGR